MFSDKENIPVIDFALADKNAAQFSKDFSLALHKYGHVKIKNHGLTKQDFQGLQNSMSEFFDLDDAVKAPFSTLSPKKDSAVFSKKQELKTENPQVLSLQKSADQMLEKLNGISKTLLQALAIYMKQDKVFFDVENNILRLIRYQDKARSNKHTDFSLLTLLYSEDRGLYMHPHGKPERMVRTDDGCLLVNSGRALAVLTNNYFRPCPHRVEMAKGETRQTIACFTNFPDGRMLDVLPQFQKYDGGIEREKWFQALPSLPVAYRTFTEQRLKNEFSNKAKPYARYIPKRRPASPKPR